MPIIGEGRFTHARFTDSNKRYIRAIWYSELNNTHEDVVILADLEDRDYQKLLEQFTVDEIATMTNQHAVEVGANFEALVKEIAKNHGLVYDPNAADGREMLQLEAIFEPSDDDHGENLLFNIKIKIFELEEVAESENTELKKALRECKTPLEAFYIAGKFLYE